MTSKSDENVVLPGDDLTNLMNGSHENTKLGTGIRRKDDEVIRATCAGLYQHRSLSSSDVYFVRQSRKRYIPRAEDRVVGVIKDRMGSDPATGGDLYRVHIGGPSTAILSSLQFEGATKRNSPHFPAGQVLYCRVENVFDCLEPELSCILGPHDKGLPRKDWMTSEGLYGELRGGTLFRVSTGLARQLLMPNNLVLSELASKKLIFEVAVGVNGLVWVHSERPEHTVVILNAIQNSGVLTSSQVASMVHSLVNTMEKEIQKYDRDE